MRDAAIRIIRQVGVETGGIATSSSRSSPRTGRMVVIEMNPRVSRSSALASKATGFPIAKIAAKLARRLHARRDPERHHARRRRRQLRADARLRRRQDPAVGVREVPRRPPDLGTQMKSVGEAMAIGRTFKEALQKALRSLEIGPRRARGGRTKVVEPSAALRERLLDPELAADLLHPARPAERAWRSTRSRARTSIDPWFLRPDRADRRRSRGASASFALDEPARRRCSRGRSASASRTGSSAHCCGTPEGGRPRAAAGGRDRPVFKRVDTCAAEFEAHTPYLYSTYEEEDEAEPTDAAQGDDPGRRARTGSARGSSSTTAAATPRSPSARRGSSRSW